MNSNYSYPIDYSWSTQEMTDVLSFFNQVEKYYESKTLREDFLKSYNNFKKIVPSKMQEKQLDREFEIISGYSTYRAVQEAKKSDRKFISSSK
ncbi:UPF0223 family protein [Streptococcaceae bacterium ESL0729]|nr:UPF0223 family protein [Streptococcaceae bacterium ESL0729]